MRADLRSERLAAVRRLGPPDPSYRKLTFYKEHLEQDQHLDAVLLGPGHPVYAAVDEKLNELLKDVEGELGVYMDPLASAPYRVHFYEITIRSQTTNGETTTVLAELVAVREEVTEGTSATERFGLVPADILIDLPGHPNPPGTVAAVHHGAVGDYVKTTVQMDRRSAASEERGRYADVAGDYLLRSFNARVRAARDRGDAAEGPGGECTRGFFWPASGRSRIWPTSSATSRYELLAWRGFASRATAPVRHVASCLVLPPDAAIDSFPELTEEQDAGLKRRVEIAAEDIVVAYEEGRNRTCERVGHLKIGFDIRSLAVADPQTPTLS